MLIEPTSEKEEYFKIQQQIKTEGMSVPLGFGDIAINSDRYMAVTAMPSHLSLTYYYSGQMVPQGNVYIIDLHSINNKGEITSPWVTLNASNLPVNKGKAPQYVTSGYGVGEFLVSNAADMNSGALAVKAEVVTVAGEKGEAGKLTGNVTINQILMSPTYSDPQWYKKFMLQNLQRAADTVIVEYDGKVYALVADYFSYINDPSFMNEYDLLPHQMGGKIGVIEDPFGYDGAPKYLGATTPITGGTIAHLSISRTGQFTGGRDYG